MWTHIVTDQLFVIIARNVVIDKKKNRSSKNIYLVCDTSKSLESS